MHFFHLAEQGEKKSSWLCEHNYTEMFIVVMFREQLSQNCPTG